MGAIGELTFGQEMRYDCMAKTVLWSKRKQHSNNAFGSTKLSMLVMQQHKIPFFFSESVLQSTPTSIQCGLTLVQKTIGLISRSHKQYVLQD